VEIAMEQARRLILIWFTDASGQLTSRWVTEPAALELPACAPLMAGQAVR
jgi:hypothetical protein